ncbi:transcription factor bHLH71 [Hibiscus syriacus]|uniref:Transcription factor bHLH71 n=1 Tax=Hibiscus syriacus TaxID=106335 RepID=A0A6A2X9U1_HIBSY|nr:transcription factor bHLH71 [Hibiscus syriacus]
MKKRKLKIFHADPFDHQSITDTLKGCSGLFYAFEPSQHYDDGEDGQGGFHILRHRHCLEGYPLIASDLDKRHWSRKFKLWHALSKTIAEKTAWALAMDRGINMVSINGGLLMGPHVSITHPYSKGAAEMYEGGTLVTDDLHFLVDAHICIFEDVSGFSRYVCFDYVVTNCRNRLSGEPGIGLRRE